MRYKINILIVSLIVSNIFLSYLSALGSVYPSYDYESKMLFIQKTCQVSLNRDLYSSDDYILTITCSEPHVIYFSNQPQRMAGSVEISNFIKVFNHNQMKNADNSIYASLNLGSFLQDEAFTHPLKLSEVEHDPTNNSISYKVKALNQKNIQIGKYKNCVIIYREMQSTYDYLSQLQHEEL